MAGDRQLRGTGAPPGVPARLAEWGGSGAEVKRRTAGSGYFASRCKGHLCPAENSRCLRLRRAREGEARLLPTRPSTRLWLVQRMAAMTGEFGKTDRSHRRDDAIGFVGHDVR